MSILDYGEYTPVVMYAEVDGSCPVFWRVCPRCGRFVKADNATRIPEYLGKDQNATCKKCGRVQMPFAWWYTEEDDDGN